MKNRREDTVPVPSDRQGFNRRWYSDSLTETIIYDDNSFGPLTSAFLKPAAELRVTSGRHCYEDFVHERGVTKTIVDMKGYDFVEEVPDGEFPVESEIKYVVGAGASNWHAFEQMHSKFLKAIPGGSCYSVGSGGHISVGGYGFLSRMAGLTSDKVKGFEIILNENGVPAPITVHQASTGLSLDLYWALRGAGAGNFGIITKFYFGDDLPDSPLYADISTYTWQWDGINSGADIESVFNVVKDIFNSEPGIGLTDTEFAIFRLYHISKGYINMTVQNVYPSEASYAADRQDYLARTADRLQAFADAGFTTTFATEAVDTETNYDPGFKKRGAVLNGVTARDAAEDITRNYTFFEAVQTLNGSGSNQRGDYKSAYMLPDGFTSDQFGTLYSFLSDTTATSDGTLDARVNIDSYGGVINQLSPIETPIPQRSSTFKLQYITNWQTTDEVGAEDPPDQENITWLRNFYSEMYEDSGGTPSEPGTVPSPTNTEGCYYGYPDTDLGQRVTGPSGSDGDVDNALRLYFGQENLDRLKQIKANFDPTNFFQHKQSIPLP